MKKLFVILFSCALASCGDGMLHEYLNADGAIWTNAPTKVDSADYAEVTLQVTGNTLELTSLYGCDESILSRLHGMEIDLVVDGEVVQPDKFEVYASYGNTYANFYTPNWCDSVVSKLGIDSSQYMDSFTVGINVYKTYSGFSELPKQPSVRFTSKSAGGDTDTTIVLTLRSSKDTRAPIRIH